MSNKFVRALRFIGNQISISYANYQERQKIRAIRQAELRDIEEENYAAGRGWAEGANSVREEERAWRIQERRRMETWGAQNIPDFTNPKSNFLTQDFQPKRRRKKR
jgi:hypothetical protein